jgi:hypothetical protein
MAGDTLIAGPYLGTSRNPYSYDKVEQVDRDVSTNWLTLEEITQQLNLFDDESQDGFLGGLEVATRMAIEDYLGMPIFPISYKVYYTTNSSIGTQMSLDLPQVSQDYISTAGVEIDFVKFYNASIPAVLETIDPSGYQYDPTGNKVILNTGLPSEVNTIMTAPIIVQYTINPSIYATYPVIKQAGLLLLTHLYNNRSNTTMEVLHKLPYGVEQLLRPYKPLVM